ncbi:MAG: hypothetical protein NUW37_10050 [Planctomycetes bacterium]|nr:hypothetical protein [Planctomycetota bacterium]
MNTRIVSSFLITMAFVAILSADAARAEETKHKVYFTLSFHGSYFHSYRGDSNTEDGFGQDIRVIRGILDRLDGYDEAKCEWDFDNYWTLETWGAEHSPDIIARVKRRVDEGKDDVRIMSWNNGIVAAETNAEFRKSIELAIESTRKTFGRIVPGVQPQECMLTPSHIKTYRELGIDWITLFNSKMPFTAIAHFTDLTLEESFNPITLKSPEGDEIVCVPTYHHGDLADFEFPGGIDKIVRFISENASGDTLFVVHFDADAESWPIMLPRILRQARSLQEAGILEWTNIQSYLDTHDPVGEIVVSRDLADGAHDGFSSWSEKPFNHEIWTDVERLRRKERAARKLLSMLPDQTSRGNFENLLAEAMLDRMKVLSTTHFGLATPTLHADRVLSAHRHVAESEAKVDIALDFAAREYYSKVETERDYLDQQLVRQGVPEWARATYIFALDSDYPEGMPVIASLPYPEELRLPAGGTTRVIWYHDLGRSTFQGYFMPGNSEAERFLMHPAMPESGVRSTVARYLEGTEAAVFDIARLEEMRARWFENAHLTFEYDDFGLPRNLVAEGLTHKFDGPDFILPHITVGDRVEYVSWNKLSDDEAHKLIPMARGSFDSGGSVELMAIPAYTPKPAMVICGRVRFPDLGARSNLLVEAVPVGINPSLGGRTIEVHKENFEEYRSSYRITEAVGSENNHVTNGWVGFSDGNHGIVVATDTTVRAGSAFCPVRTMSQRGNLRVELNPFGTYWSDARRYAGSVVPRSGMGYQFTTNFGAHVKPTGPAFSGADIRFRLMVTFFNGNRPGEAEIAQSKAFAYPPVRVRVER